MDSRSDLQAKLAYLTVKLSDSPEALSAEERQKHLDMLRDVMNAMGSMEKDLKKAVDESNPDACILRVVGGRSRAADGKTVYPKRKDIQQNLNTVFREMIRSEVRIEVHAMFVEVNFNQIANSLKANDYLQQEEELYVKVGSPEQMECILEFKDIIRRVGFEFSKPNQKSATREAYKAIGNLLLRLKTVDKKCKMLDAIPDRGGLPILPDQMVQTEQFDETVKAFEENVEDVSGKLKHGPLTAKQYLHAYLCSKTRVDKRKRQTALDPLIDERIEILKKLAQFDTDEFPFTYEREFK